MHRFVTIDSKIYTLTDFSHKFGFSYYICLQYYKKGFRDEDLLKALNKRTSTVKFGNHTFKSRLAAAKHFKIAPTTFYRYAKQGKAEQLIKKKKALENLK